MYFSKFRLSKKITIIINGLKPNDLYMLNQIL